MMNYMGFKNASEWLRFFIDSGKCDVKTLIKTSQVDLGNGVFLPPRLYRFLNGPFKGSLFTCTAPDLRLMNEHPWFEVEFISGPCKGLKTSSLITYDRKIICLEPTWRKLLSKAAIKL